MQSVPLMTSEHECVQQVSRGLLQSSVCTETHLFRPFSSQGSGALTSVTQTLTFRAQAAGVSTRKGESSSRHGAVHCGKAGGPRGAN